MQTVAYWANSMAGTTAILTAAPMGMRLAEMKDTPMAEWWGFLKAASRELKRAVTRDFQKAEH